VLIAILSQSGEFIKLPYPSIEPPDDYKWKWFGNALGALDGCHVDVCVFLWLTKGCTGIESNKLPLTC
jgi:hypothetical protein